MGRVCHPGSREDDPNVATTHPVAHAGGGDPVGTQWATGRSSAATADHVTVQAGQTTRVDDTLAVPGAVTLTVLDSLTGVPVP